MNDGLSDISASVRARLNNLAREEGRPFQELLFHYGMERFLYRLSKSRFRDDFILKGGLVFEVQQLPGRRFTRDVDLLSCSENSMENIRKIIGEICNLEVIPDGLLFDLRGIQVEEIRKPAESPGIRVRFRAFLGSAKIPMQLDLGFSDEVYPEPKLVVFPTLLEMVSPRILRYPWESVVAEKFEAMIRLGAINSRMKDFYDIWLLSRQIPFEGEKLAEAIRRTFSRRQTPIPNSESVIFGLQFAEHRQPLWSQFAVRTGVEGIPNSFAEILESLAVFLLPLCVSLNAKEDYGKRWQPGVGWQ